MAGHAEVRSVALGLVGAGISRSLTPALHEQEGRHAGLSVTYRIIDSDVAGFGIHDLLDVLAWAQKLGFDGLNVTHPFKQEIVPSLDVLSDEVQAIGAVNTVVFRDGKTIGYNTDWSGWGRAFRRQLPEAATDRSLLIGAGGAGAAVGYALLEQGAERVAVYDVNAHKAAACVARLAAQFGRSRVVIAADLPAELDVAQGIVNATPVGMIGHEGTPLPVDRLRSELWVCDVVYFPLETHLLHAARERECRVVNGGGMAVYQAAAAFELFTQTPADADRMLAHFKALVD